MSADNLTPLAELVQQLERERTPATATKRPRSVAAARLVLGPTRINSPDDVEQIIFGLHDGTVFSVLEQHLDFRRADVIALSMICAELTQNVLDHADSHGWAAAWVTGPGVAQLAVVDGGRGMASSLGVADDAEAIRAGTSGTSRFPQAGRGEGLHQVRRKIARWDGSFLLRSGTAELRQDGTAPEQVSAMEFQQGVQICIQLRARRNEK